MNDITEIPTADLLAELDSRYRSGRDTIAPAWAYEIIAAVAAEAATSVRKVVESRSTDAHQVVIRDTVIALLRHYGDAEVAAICPIFGMKYHGVYRSLQRTERDLVNKGPISRFMRGCQKRIANAHAQ